MYRFSQWTPGPTPRPIKHIIVTTCIFTLLSMFVQSLFNQFDWGPGPQYIFGLSWKGLTDWQLWKPITYLLVQGGWFDLTISFVATLAFNMYLLWTVGTPVMELIGVGSFLRLYAISGIVSGIVAISLAALFGQYPLIGTPIAPIITFLVLWSMAFANIEIYLFFLIPFKAKWLVTAVLGFLLVTALLKGDVAHLLLYLCSMLIGYGYATLAHGWHSPFSFTQPLDRRLASLGLRLRRYLPEKIRVKSNTKEKIIHLHPVEAIHDDDAFVDAMLAKISKYGENSLSRSERKRMEEISKQKTRPK